MNNGSIAKRYAQALFEEAKAQGVDRQVYDALGTLHATMRREHSLQLALINPRVSPDKKHSLLMLAAETQSGLLSRFMRLLLQNRREGKLRLVIYVYRDLYRLHHGIDRVVLETAVPAPAESLVRLTERIHRRTGHEVELVQKVNPSIVGGFRLRIGDRRYDNSYKYKLEQIRKRLCLTK